ncbi:hypothetical protein PBAL39_12840 [Pedobacter sp. BAL39]|uniref:hypothetical protein n=1 Tax=Pedobacter sp. BAL39 TaxID=391596 RepID=UPI000155923C|nr:hypothetical protein [Pedobacter sp. BAL39]EDM35356.1 hypothetical protein PBAL39_12840 [Pedobacter sp. BAL39]
MLLTIFSGLYELISGSNEDVPEYFDEVYDTVGQITVAVIMLMILIFYLLLGRWKPVFHKLGHWISTLILIMVAAFGIAFITARDVIGEVDAYTVRFSLMNAILSALLFILLSIIFKRMSVFSKRTPF